MLPVIATLLESTAAIAASGPGEQLYHRYCASCHGTAGHGDGPAAAALCPRPSDLTKSTVDIPALMRWIDGRRTVPAHGTAAMPTWGEVFEQSLIGEPYPRQTARQRAKLPPQQGRR